MRVLIDYRPALRERSGVGEYTHQLVRALLRAFPRTATDGRLDLTLFSSSWKDRLRPLAEVDGASVIDRRVPVSVLNFAWHRLRWPPAETLAGRDFDVTHSLHPLLMPSRRAAQVMTIHDLDFLRHPERTRAEIRRDYASLVHDHARRADRVIVVSRFTASEVERRLGVPADRISLCPPGAPDWTPRLSPPANGYVLFFGTLEARKNIGGLLDAYEQLLSPAKAGHHVRVNNGQQHDGRQHDGQQRDGRQHDGLRRDAPQRDGRHSDARARIPDLVLAGRATEAAQPWLDRIARPPLAGRVRHIGYVQPANRRELYDGALLLVQPSFDEGFGMPVLEAMTLGIPVVASNRGALPEVLGDAGLLVDPDDATGMANAIERMIEDEAFAAESAAKGLLRSRQFTWELTARRALDAYQQAIDAHRH